MGIFSSKEPTTQTYSSFGQGGTTTGPKDLEGQTPEAPAAPLDNYVDPNSYFYSDRSKKLRYASKWYSCTQHDSKMFDFWGRYRQHEELWGSQPLIGQEPSFYVPLDQRRPMTPKRLGRTITKRFTSLLFGQNRFPQLRSDDPATQDYAEELAKIGQVRIRIMQARNMGGSCGTAGISWCFFEGKPVNRVHDGSQIYCLEWKNFDSKIPAHVMELYQLPMTGRNEKGELVEMPHWIRRDWTIDEDIVFKPTPVKDTGERVLWQRDDAQCFRHGDGAAHFIWITNDSEAKQASIDGEPDYEGQFESLDTLDILNSVLASGGVKNLDPTLILEGVDPKDMGMMVLKKGSDHAIATGTDDKGMARKVSYLELSGTSITAGLELIKMHKNAILEDVQCVIPDPDEVAAAGVSSIAIKMIYSPMINVADTLREHYGEMGILRLLNDQIRSARRMLGRSQAAPLEEVAPPEPDGDPSYEVPVDGEIETDEFPANDVIYFLDLEPRKEPALDSTGKPTGEMRTVEREPGTGSLSLEWGEYFPPTMAEKQVAVTAASAAAGAKPVASQQSMVETVSGVFNLDAQKEWGRVQDEAAAARSFELGLTPGFGGGTGTPAAPTQAEIPPGTETPPGTPGEPGAEPINIDVDSPDETPGVHPIALANADDGLITPTDVSKIVSVNEARRSIHLGPLLTKDGREDPDGNLTVAEFAAKREALGSAQGEAQGTPFKPPAPVAKAPAVPAKPAVPPVKPPFTK
jgi:hypothetical protein